MTNRDTVEDREGEWMSTSLGGRFFPSDPRPEEIFMSDIANGLALDCRYGGQGRVDRFYSVAEHSVHMSQAALRASTVHPNIDAECAMVALLHDASEAWINDLTRATKAGTGCLADSYIGMENAIQACVWERYGLEEAAIIHWAFVKDLDRRMVPLEKAAIFRHQQPWAFDQYEPLEGVKILCLSPQAAKRFFVVEYWTLCASLGWDPEEIEI